MLYSLHPEFHTRQEEEVLPEVNQRKRPTEVSGQINHPVISRKNVVIGGISCCTIGCQQGDISYFIIFAAILCNEYDIPLPLWTYNTLNSVIEYGKTFYEQLLTESESDYREKMIKPDCEQIIFSKLFTTLQHCAVSCKQLELEPVIEMLLNKLNLTYLSVEYEGQTVMVAKESNFYWLFIFHIPDKHMNAHLVKFSSVLELAAVLQVFLKPIDSNNSTFYLAFVPSELYDDDVNPNLFPVGIFLRKEKSLRRFDIRRLFQHVPPKIEPEISESDFFSDNEYHDAQAIFKHLEDDHVLLSAPAFSRNSNDNTIYLTDNQPGVSQIAPPTRRMNFIQIVDDYHIIRATKNQSTLVLPGRSSTQCMAMATTAIVKY